MALLMTPTLWNSIDWMAKCPPSWKASAYEGLSDMLNRVWTENPAVKRGMEFENAICKKKFSELTQPAEDIGDKFKEAYDLIHAEGHVFQKRSKRFVRFDGKEFILYGKLDVSFPEETIDIKTTGNYRGMDSYLSGWQHKVYCYTERKRKFKYVVFELNEANILVDVYIIEYEVEDFKALEEDIMSKLESVVKLLRSDKKLEKAYMTKFNRYN